MRIKIKLHPGSSQEKLEKLNELEYEIWIKEKPIDGKANNYLMKFLKKEFGCEAKVVGGFTSRLKTVELED